MAHCSRDYKLKMKPKLTSGSPVLQSNLLLLAMGLMKGGSLKLALQAEDTRDSLRWNAWWGRHGGQRRAGCCVSGGGLPHRLQPGCPLSPESDACTCSDMPRCFGSGWCSGHQVAIDVAEALAYLHDQNVLHGDICAR